MFSKQIQIILAVLGNALIWLANLPEDYDHKGMTGREYIDTLDNPEQGTDVTPTVTGTAAQVFAPAEPVVEPATAAAVFAPAPVAAPTPVYTMTPAAQGYTREQYLATPGWNDEALIEQGLMTVTHLDTRPNVPAPVALTTPPASAPATVSTPAAAAPAPASTDAPAVMRDKDGLPWDARIHSSSRTQNNDGTWKKKKGVQPGIVAQVTTELLNAAPAPAFQPLSAAAPVAPPPPPSATVAPAPVPAPAPPPAQVGAAPTTFLELCKWMPTVGLTPPQVEAVAAPYGVAGMAQLAQPANAHLVPLIYADLMKQRGA